MQIVRWAVAAGCVGGPMAGAAAGAAVSGPAVAVAGLRCEQRAEPAGIDSVRPRLSWQILSARRGERQTAYRVRVASSPGALAGGRADVWDSGCVASDRSTLVPFGGRALRSAERCWWSVRVWGADGRPSPWSAPASWSMGLLRPGDWGAVWIGSRSSVVVAGTGLGFHATEAASATDLKWVQVDLGRPRPIDSVRLCPLDHVGVKGFGFPLRFRIEACDEPGFGAPRVIADHTATDFANPGITPLTAAGRGVRARYVRVTALRIWNRGNGSAKPYCFGLAELEVISTGRNAARGAPVTASDSVEQWGWGSAQLTDGRSSQSTAGPDEFAAPLLRREVTLRGPIRRATAFFCGLGYGELYLNGRKVGGGILEPAWTDYTRRALYSTHDVTRLLRPGRNAVGAVLGNGWYRLPTPDLFGYERASWVAPPKMLLQIRVEYADGGVERIVSDRSWRWAYGPIRFNCVRGGETYDARRRMAGWCAPGFDARRWRPVAALAGPKGRLVASQIPPVRVTERIRPVRLSEPKPGVFVFDLGRHIAGFARLTASGAAGSVVTLDFDENVNADGTITTKSLNSHTNGRYQVGELILSGRGVDAFEPRFTYHGFRYVQVRGLAARPTLATLTGLAAHTDLRPAGDFACSNPLINRIHAAVRYSILNCHHGIQTEPAREKVNWTEDAHNTFEPAMLSFDYATFGRKWLEDVLDSQEPGGHVPPINPLASWGRARPDGMPPDWSDPWWGGVSVEIPWLLYAYYGDQDALARSYAPMRRFVDFLGRTPREWPYLDWWLGDWLEVGASGGRSSRMPIVQASTLAYFHYAGQVARAAGVLGRPADQKRYAGLAARIREAYNRRFLNPATGLYAPDSQSAQAMPLLLGAVPDAQRDLVLARLTENVAARGGHISAGFVGYLYVLRALTAAGRADLAYGMAAQAEFPGWGHMLHDGGTTLWEAWDGNAFNFTSLGAVGAWFYEALGGIAPDARRPGFRNVIVHPHPVGDLTWARAHHESPYGRVAVMWRRAAGRFVLSAEIPANATATVYLPAGRITEGGREARRAPGVRSVGSEGECAVVEIGSGRYRFVSEPLAAGR